MLIILRFRVVVREKHWCTVVGKEQSLLPVYIRQHYCDPQEALNNLLVH